MSQRRQTAQEEQVHENNGTQNKDKIQTQEEELSRLPIHWPLLTFFAIIHALAFYGVFHFSCARRGTIILKFVFGYLGGLGVTAGAHRLWTHRCYKARLPLSIFLAFCNTVALQNPIIVWALDHRVHHKFSDTNADPHNAKRGLFFSHMGWLISKSHPDNVKKAKTVDISDLVADPVCKYQYRLYLILAPVFAILVPSYLPVLLWDEDFLTSFYLTMFRYAVSLHATWTVNSLAHFYGNKPYDKNIRPAENFLVCTLAIGEGFHNYHHAFPYDYSTSEFGWKMNITTAFIDFMALIGQAYDLKKPAPETILLKMQNTGDGTKGFGFSKN